MKKPATGLKPQKSKKRPRQPTPLPIVLILAMIVCLLTTMVAVIQASAGLADKLPVTLHSLLFADYSADPHGFRIAAVRFNLIEEAIRDADGGQNLDSADRFATLQAGLNTSVPTVTPEFPQTPTATQQQPTTTPTHIEPSLTPSPTFLPTQTATVEPTQSPTITRWNPTATHRPDKPSKPPEDPDPTDPPPADPPPPTDRPPPSPTKPPPPPPTKPPPPPDPYPPAYP